MAAIPYMSILTAFQLVFYFHLASASKIPYKIKEPPQIGNDRYVTFLGEPEWCLFCTHESLSHSQHYQSDCVHHNPHPVLAVMEDDKYSNLLWCFDIGKPPQCIKPELGVHVIERLSDPLHPYYTHTELTVNCSEGFRPGSPANTQTLTVICLENSLQWNSTDIENFKCVPKEDLVVINDDLDSESKNKSNNVTSKSEHDSNLWIGVAFGIIFICIFAVLIFCAWRKGWCSKCIKATRSICNLSKDKTKNPTIQATGDKCSTSNRDVSQSLLELDNLTKKTADPNIVEIRGTPESCITDMVGFEGLDNGKVHKKVTEKLNVLDDGIDKSWICLARNVLQLTRLDIQNIKRCYGIREHDGPGCKVISLMREDSQTIGHLVEHLYCQKMYDYVKIILEHHTGCEFCEQFRQHSNDHSFDNDENV